MNSVSGRNEKLALDIAEFLVKFEMNYDTSIYFNGKCLRFNSSGELKVLDNKRASQYFEYADDSSVSMSFEGPLYGLLNGEGGRSAEKVTNAFNRVFSKHKCYYELGNAWNLTVYWNK